MEFFVLTTAPESSASWTDEQRLARWARVMDWHEHARELNASGKLPCAWGLRQLPHTSRPSAVAHGLVSIYQTESLAEFTALLDSDPLREVSDYMTVPLTTLDGDYATDVNRFDDARAALIGQDPVSVLRYAEYEAVMAKQPEFVGKYAPRVPANEPVDFDRTSEPGDPIEFLVNGVNPDGYVGMWDDLRHLMHYQKVLWWHHYTWMMATQGIKSHTWGTHDYCTTIRNTSRTAGALDVYRVAKMSELTAALALDPIRDDSIMQIAALRPVADQLRSDERRATQAMRQAGHTGLTRPVRTTVHA
jgi:hypothetical protein